MDAVKFIEERNRMCDSYAACCDDCPMYTQHCNGFRSIDVERLVSVVEEWSAAHPRKTRQSVFLEQYPQADIDNTGLLFLCPKRISADTGYRRLHVPEVLRLPPRVLDGGSKIKER